MARNKAERLENERNRLTDIVEAGEIAGRDADLIRELIDAYDEEKLTIPKPEGESYRTNGTLAAWCERLTTCGRRLSSLADATTTDINQAMQEMQGEGRSKTTVRNYQYALRRFYRFHDDLGVNPSDIAAYEPEGNGFDPEDVLTRDGIEQVKQACENARDNLIFHLLVYTGMRNTAARTLRVKDVKVDEGASGRYRVNPEADGLKGAADTGEWRPLLGATGAVREWLKYHPDPEPENYLVTAQPNYPQVDPTEPVTRETIRYTMQQLKEGTGIEKPMHPHMMRHTFVTVCKRDYDMDNDTIKWLIHHSADSRVMETTYAHLSDEDWIERAEAGAGYTDLETESTLSPMACNVCGTSLGPDARACSNCGAVYTPDARAAKDEIEADMKRDYAETDPGDADTQGKLDTLDDLLDDPEVKAALLDKLADE